MKHTWRKKKNGKIDSFASASEYCNGPVCARCGFTFCEQCAPDKYEDESCPSDEELLTVRAKRYKEKVLSALRDDGKLSLSFTDIEVLTIDEIKQILPIALVYGEWLLAVRDRAKAIWEDETGFVECADKIDELYSGMLDLCKKLGVE